jgi:uncharacterized protein (TIGR02996 family)
MSATGQGLLQAIAAEPDDDTHRLVCADWVHDQGRPERAEFIRAQVTLARDPTDSPERRALAFRARELLDAHEAEWLGDLRKRATEWYFRRGFVDYLSLPGSELEAMAERFATLPLRRLAVRDMAGDPGWLSVIPETTKITHLDLTANRLNLYSLQGMADWSRLPDLEHLTLQFNQLDDTAIPLLCQSRFFAGLSLHLGANPFTADGREQLREHFGSRVSFVCERHPDHLYAFDDHRFTTGTIPGHYQVFGYWDAARMLAFRFDFEGTLLDVLHRPFITRNPRDYNARGAEEVEWQGELQFAAGPIRVKRFRVNERVGINDFNWWARAFDRADHQGNDLHSAAARWVRNGQFEWAYSGDNVWVDRAGEVTDT